MKIDFQLNASGIAQRLKNRGRSAAMLAYLSARRRLNGKPLWIDNGRIRLPFHGDGDRQELYYHLDGKVWWDKEMRLISPYLTQGDVVVDVGANLGFMSGIFSTLIGAKGRVYSFEPSPLVYSKLLQVITSNRYDNVSAYNLGCGSKDQSLVLHGSSSSGGASLRPNPRSENPAHGVQTVQVVRLDDFLGPKLERLDFLKIDTEGFEDEVLLGAERTLERFMPVVYIELCSEYLNSSERSIAFLRGRGYIFDQDVNLSEAHDGTNFFALPPNFQR